MADDAELDMLPANPEKPTHQFLIHQLNMRQVGRGRAAPFVAAALEPGAAGRNPRARAILVPGSPTILGHAGRRHLHL